MVELKLTDPAKEADWDAWYLSHLYKLIRVPGFRSAQRFRTDASVESPQLAIYDIENADVMTSPAYTSVGGRGSADQWKHLLTNWHRNLFEYAHRAPNVRPGQHLIVLDRHVERGGPLPEGFTALKPVGLDHTLLERAFRVVDRLPDVADYSSWSPRLFKPVTELLKL